MIIPFRQHEAPNRHELLPKGTLESGVLVPPRPTRSVKLPDLRILRLNRVSSLNPWSGRASMPPNLPPPPCRPPPPSTPHPPSGPRSSCTSRCALGPPPSLFTLGTMLQQHGGPTDEQLACQCQSLPQQRAHGGGRSAGSEQSQSQRSSAPDWAEPVHKLPQLAEAAVLGVGHLRAGWNRAVGQCVGGGAGGGSGGLHWCTSHQLPARPRCTQHQLHSQLS